MRGLNFIDGWFPQAVSKVSRFYDYDSGKFRQIPVEKWDGGTKHYPFPDADPDYWVPCHSSGDPRGVVVGDYTDYPIGMTLSQAGTWFWRVNDVEINIDVPVVFSSESESGNIVADWSVAHPDPGPPVSCQLDSQSAAKIQFPGESEIMELKPRRFRWLYSAPEGRPNDRTLANPHHYLPADILDPILMDTSGPWPFSDEMSSAQIYSLSAEGDGNSSAANVGGFILISARPQMTFLPQFFCDEKYWFPMMVPCGTSGDVLLRSDRAAVSGSGRFDYLLHGSPAHADWVDWLVEHHEESIDLFRFAPAPGYFSGGKGAPEMEGSSIIIKLSESNVVTGKIRTYGLTTGDTQGSGYNTANTTRIWSVDLGAQGIVAPEPDPVEPAPMYSRLSAQAAPMEITITPQSYFTYGGIYDETTGARI